MEFDECACMGKKGEVERVCGLVCRDDGYVSLRLDDVIVNGTHV